MKPQLLFDRAIGFFAIDRIIGIRIKCLRLCAKLCFGWAFAQDSCQRHRLAIAQTLGFDTINPAEVDLPAEINSRTAGKGADVVFEVSGTQPGVDAMTAIAATRARIVMVAIHAQKPTIDLFQFFWRELKLIGARVYEPEDYEKAIGIIAAGGVDADTVITDVAPLSEIQTAFEALDRSPTALKTLIKISG